MSPTRKWILRNAAQALAQKRVGPHGSGRTTVRSDLREADSREAPTLEDHRDRPPLRGQAAGAPPARPPRAPAPVLRRADSGSLLLRRPEPPAHPRSLRREELADLPARQTAARPGHHVPPDADPPGPGAAGRPGPRTGAGAGRGAAAAGQLHGRHAAADQPALDRPPREVRPRGRREGEGLQTARSAAGGRPDRGLAPHAAGRAGGLREADGPADAALPGAGRVRDRRREATTPTRCTPRRMRRGCCWSRRSGSATAGTPASATAGSGRAGGAATRC